MANNGDFPQFKGSTASEMSARPGAQSASGCSTWLLVVIGVFAGFALLFAVGVKACSGHDGDESRVTCGARDSDAREKWLNTRTREFGGASPADQGFRAEGDCNIKIESRGLACDESSVIGIERDAPYLRAAASVGFQIYVCTEPGGKRIEYPIAKIVGTKASGR